MAEEGRSRLLGDQKRGNDGIDEAGPLYHDNSQTPTMKLMQLAFVAIVICMVLITVIISIYQGSTVGGTLGGLYFMLGLSLLGFVALEIFMVIFVRKGDLPAGKTWFLYFVGGCIILEAIFTDVLLFHQD